MVDESQEPSSAGLRASCWTKIVIKTGPKAYQVTKQRESNILHLLVLTWHAEASGVLFDPQRLILQMLYKHLTFQELQCEISEAELVGNG